MKYALLALLLLAATAAGAVTFTTKYAVTNAGWTDLGVGPMLLSFQGTGVYAIADTSPASISKEGFTVLSGDSVSLNTASHVWAMAAGNQTVSVYVAPISTAGGGGGSGWAGPSTGTPVEPSSTVGTTSAQLLAAAAATTFIQLCVPASAANSIWVNWAGAAATAAAPSQEITAGGCQSWGAVFLPTTQVNAIASASTPVTLMYK